MTRETAVAWDLCEFELRRRGCFLRGLASEERTLKSVAEVLEAWPSKGPLGAREEASLSPSYLDKGV